MTFDLRHLPGASQRALRTVRLLCGSAGGEKKGVLSPCEEEVVKS